MKEPFTKQPVSVTKSSVLLGLIFLHVVLLAIWGKKHLLYHKLQVQEKI